MAKSKNVRPRAGCPVLVIEGDDKRIYEFDAQTAETVCTGVVRQIAAGVYLWTRHDGAEGKRNEEWEAFMALGYELAAGGAAVRPLGGEPLAGADALAAATGVAMGEAPRPAGTGLEKMTLDAGFHIIRPGDRVTIATEGYAGRTGVVRRIRRAQPSVLVFVGEQDVWLANDQLTLAKEGAD